MSVYAFHADYAWFEQRLQADVRIEVDAHSGLIRTIQAACPRQAGDERVGRLLLPAIPNAHSHVFQRLIAGTTEFQSDPADDFWSWREAMYACALRLSPDDLYAVARHTYREMQCAGYGQVSEFHYVHLDPQGQPYARPAAMSEALIAAAQDCGIALTLLPVLYQQGGFDRRPLSARQCRFGLELDRYGQLLADLRAREHARLRIGIAIHSLRAVSPEALRKLLDSELAATGPIHIHIAEQQAEVAQCLEHYGARPIQWLHDHVAVDQRWHLVHATHADAEELRCMVRSGATVVLCPSTEANLGDGLFPLPEFLEAGGNLAIGSDSHIELDPIEELKLAEYGQRLRLRARNRCASAAEPSVATRLLAAVLDGGARAADQACGELSVGAGADFIGITPAAGFEADSGSRLLDTLVFARPRGALRAWSRGRALSGTGTDSAFGFGLRR